MSGAWAVGTWTSWDCWPQCLHVALLLHEMVASESSALLLWLTHCTGGYRWGAQTLDCHLLLGEFWGSGRACSWSSRVAAVAVLENNILPQQSGPILASFFFFFFVCFRSIFYDLRDKRSGILCPYPWIELKTLGVCELSVENNFLKGF